MFMHPLINQNKSVYNAIASQFSATRAFLWDDLKGLERYAQAHDTILDLGCGNGRLYQLFQNMQVDYTGVDQSEGLLEQAKEKFPNQQFLLGDFAKIPLQDNSVDKIYAIASYHHLPDETTRVQSLFEMKRVLKTNGTIILLNWNLHSDWAKKKYAKVEKEPGEFFVPWKTGDGESLGERYYHGFTLEELADLAEQADLKVQENFYIKKGEVSDKENGENMLTVLS